MSFSSLLVIYFQLCSLTLHHFQQPSWPESIHQSTVRFLSHRMELYTTRWWICLEEIRMGVISGTGNGIPASQIQVWLIICQGYNWQRVHGSERCHIHSHAPSCTVSGSGSQPSSEERISIADMWSDALEFNQSRHYQQSQKLAYL